MRPLKFPLITIASSFSIGIIAAYYLDFSLEALLICLSVLLLLLWFFYWKSKKNLIQNSAFGIITYLLSIALGMLTFFIHADKNQANHYSKQPFEPSNSIRAIVETSIKPNAKYYKYFVQINEFNSKEASGKLLLYVPKTNLKKLKSGDEIWLKNSVYPIPKAFNPYQFDYANYMKKQNVLHQVYASENQIKIIQTHKNFSFHIEQLRNKLSSSFEIHHFEPKTKGIIEALLLGQRVDLDKETVADYSNSGVIHILAISGLHISILYFFIVFLLKPLKRFRFGKELQLIIVLILLWLFAFITGLPASVTRAVTLFSFVSIGAYFNRPKATFNAIAVSALLILLVKPNAIFDIGFQLSYAAVISIVLFQPFYKKLYFTKNKIARYFIDIVLVSLAAQVGVLPLSLYYFNQLPMLFLLANLVIIPIATAVLIGGIIILILNFTIPSLAILLGKILAFLIEIMNQYIHWIAQFKGGIITNISFSGLLTLLLYLVIISFIYWLYQTKAKNFKPILIAILLFQLSYFGIKLSENKNTEALVLNAKSTTIVIKQNNKVLAFTDEPEVNAEVLNHYKRGTFSDSLRIFSLQNTLSFNGKRILIIDSSAVYKTSMKPEIIILTKNPKVNLSRLIQELQPKLIIADKNNYKNLTKTWEATCINEKIPFHAVAEKGFYILK